MTRKELIHFVAELLQEPTVELKVKVNSCACPTLVNTPTGTLKQILKNRIAVKDWSGVEKVAGELHRRELFNLNSEPITGI